MKLSHILENVNIKRGEKIMYKENYLAQILLNGEARRESRIGDDLKEVALPIDSEYSILLRNDSYESVKAVVKIGGKNIIEYYDDDSPKSGFYVAPKTSMNIERFVRNLEQGKKFKLVTSNHPDVDDPNDPENSFITIEWYKLIKDNKEKDLKEELEEIKKRLEDIKKSKDYWPTIYPYYPRPYEPINPYSPGRSLDISWFSNITGTTNISSNIRYNFDSNEEDCKLSMKCCSMENFEEKVATIEGSKSTQKFTSIEGNFSSGTICIMKFKLVGIKSKKINYNKKYCMSCGKELKISYKFCPMCGQVIMIREY